MSHTPRPDILEAGSGHRVILVHSSVAGARQWRRLMDVLEPDFHAVAVNLYGYGGTAPWQDRRAQTLRDQAELIGTLLPEDGGSVSIVGHSFGGAVAMKAAALYKDRVRRLVLIEPNPFYLLNLQGREDAYMEAIRLRGVIKACGATGNWRQAAEAFAEYWTGEGSWAAMPADRQAKFAEALKPNFHEWDAVMGEDTPLSDWVRDLPGDTCVIISEDTVGSIRAIASLLEEAAPHWTYRRIARGGHMAALSMADEINPIVAQALR